MGKVEAKTLIVCDKSWILFCFTKKLLGIFRAGGLMLFLTQDGKRENKWSPTWNNGLHYGLKMFKFPIKNELNLDSMNHLTQKVIATDNYWHIHDIISSVKRIRWHEHVFAALTNFKQSSSSSTWVQLLGTFLTQFPLLTLAINYTLGVESYDLFNWRWRRFNARWPAAWGDVQDQNGKKNDMGHYFTKVMQFRSEWCAISGLSTRHSGS